MTDKDNVPTDEADLYKLGIYLLMDALHQRVVKKQLNLY